MIKFKIKIFFFLTFFSLNSYADPLIVKCDESVDLKAIKNGAAVCEVASLTAIEYIPIERDNPSAPNNFCNKCKYGSHSIPSARLREDTTPNSPNSNAMEIHVCNQYDKNGNLVNLNKPTWVPDVALAGGDAGWTRSPIYRFQANADYPVCAHIGHYPGEGRELMQDYFYQRTPKSYVRYRIINIAPNYLTYPPRQAQ